MKKPRKDKAEDAKKEEELKEEELDAVSGGWGSGLGGGIKPTSLQLPLTQTLITSIDK